MVRKHQTRNLEISDSRLRRAPGMTLVVARKKESLANVSLHRARHLPCHRVLFLHLRAGGKGAHHLRRQAAGHDGTPRFRTGVPRADEYAGMDADLPAVALAVR